MADDLYSIPESEFEVDDTLDGVELDEVPDTPPAGDAPQDEPGTESIPRGMADAPRTGREAIAWAREQHRNQSSHWKGECLNFVRQAFECPAGIPSAADAWDIARNKREETNGDNVPRGVPFFWLGGSHGYGHVVLSCGGGLCWSTDIREPGHVSLVRINEITDKWGERPVGWSEDLNGLRVWNLQRLPVVDLSNVREQFLRAIHHERVAVNAGVKQIQRALNARYCSGLKITGLVDRATLNAYGRHEHHVGVEGRPRVPDDKTLHLLGRHRFVVVK